MPHQRATITSAIESNTMMISATHLWTLYWPHMIMLTMTIAATTNAGACLCLKFIPIVIFPIQARNRPVPNANLCQVDVCLQ